MTFEAGQTVGHYRIADKLGQGGMATVYRAYEAKLDRYVAIKVLHPAFMADPNFIERFEREARIIARLEHPHIVPIFGADEHDSQPFLIMKFIDGETLKARLARQPLTLAETIKILDAVAGALSYAHQAGVLHRDIKPSNILMENSTGNPYLADFGLARMADAGESTMSQDVMLGTPHYISPEQAQGLKLLSPGTDIYSLGVVLYEIIVGRVPFMADTPYAIVHDHIFAPLPLPSKVNPAVPPQIETVLLRALSKDPLDRFATAVDMANAFKVAVADAGIESLPSGQYRVPFPANERVTTGTTALDTPRPTGSLIVSPTIPIPAGITPTPTAIMSDQLRSLSELRRIEQRRLQQANLWVFGGVAGLILTCLFGALVTVFAFADPKVQAVFVPDNPPAASQLNGEPTAIALANGTLTATSRPKITTARPKIATVAAALNPSAETSTATPEPTQPTATSTASRTPNPTSEAIVRTFLDVNAPQDARDHATQTLYQTANTARRQFDTLLFQTLVKLPGAADSGDARALLALANYRADQKKSIEALLVEAKRLAPDSTFVMLITGSILKDEKRVDAARTALDAAKNTAASPQWIVDEATRLLRDLG